MTPDTTDSQEARRFIWETLGPRSSHPDVMEGQRRHLMRLALVPFVCATVVLVLVLTHYQARDFAAVQDWASFLKACSVLWGRIKLSAIVLALFGCVFAGFAFTIDVLWLVGMALGSRGEKLKITDKDYMPFPWWLLVGCMLFWLVPAGLFKLQGVLLSIDWRLNLVLQLFSNLLCLAPLTALIVWTRWAGYRREPGPDEELRHSVGHLLSALAWLVLAVAILVLPRPAIFTTLIESRFRWVLRCGIELDALYGYVRGLLGACLALCGLFHLLLWRLKVKIYPKKRGKGAEGAENNKEEPNQNKNPASKTQIPESARHLLANLPNRVTAERGPDGKFVYRKSVGVTSDPANDVKYGLVYLMDGGKTPTEDQSNFFSRYVESFQKAQDEFEKRVTFEDGKIRPDMLLIGEDGSGRTEILLAAALYAAVVRGQRVLFMCADGEDCSLLATRASNRLNELGVGVYLSSGVLDASQMEFWLDLSTKVTPPDLLFATPENVERLFFANPATRSQDKARQVREMLTGFGAVFVDDFLDMPITFRAHAAFLIAKLKLLQSAAPTLAQYVVAVGEVDRKYGVDKLAGSLFGPGLAKENIRELHPRNCEDYWFGTLRVARADAEKDESSTLLDVVRELAVTTAKNGCNALFYQKGMSSEEKDNFEKCIHPSESGSIRVATRFRELRNLGEEPDNVFYLTLASGEAGTALRLNLGSGDPVFFRIVWDGEREVDSPQQYGLLPDKTATTLRTYHLRNVLQFVDPHVPLPDEAWARFQIDFEDENIHEFTPGGKAGTVKVSWLHDVLIDNKYKKGDLGAYLTLQAKAAHLATGAVDFNCLPIECGKIWKVTGEDGRLLLAEEEGKADTERRPGYLALWRNVENGTGESDLSHSDELVYVRQNEYTVAESESVDSQRDPVAAKRYEVKFNAWPRHGDETEHIIPVRNLKWEVPSGELSARYFEATGERAFFQVERTSFPTCLVNGELRGRLNLRGEEKSAGPHSYSYEAYLSCLVWLPTLMNLGEVNAEQQIQACLDGIWQTNASHGFSSALTHALATVLREKIADWPFFAVAPVFWTEGRGNSVGCVTIWIIEPANSGRVVQPLLKRLMEDPKFRMELYNGMRDLLGQCKTLPELRMASHLAFAGESLLETGKHFEDDRIHALSVIDMLLGGNADGRNRKEVRDDEPERKQRERRERNETVAWEKYRDHVLFRAKGHGNVKQCRGKIHVRVFFVDDADSSWDDSARDVCRKVLADVARTLEREAGPAAGLEVSWSDENRKTDRSCSDMEIAHSEVPALLGASGRPGVSKIQNEFKKAHKCDEAPLVFVWNRKIRSCCEASDSPYRHAEWATIGLENDIHGDTCSLWSSLLHELLHLFGAVDYYYPDAVKEAAMKWLPSSVMNEGGGTAIDDLTRVLVGWDDTLSPAATTFLNDTSHVTLKEIDDALGAELKK